MNELRLSHILAQMEKQNLTQLIISDSASIFYLTGRHIDSGERMLALYLNQNGKHRLFVNALFTVPEDLGVEKVWFSDTEDSLSLLASYIDKNQVLGIDKNMPARFLLGLMERQAAKNYVNASACIDLVRMIKDDEEQALMRHASKLNCDCMQKLKQLPTLGCTEESLGTKIVSLYKEAGTSGPSFSPLIAFGANAAIGHHEPSDSTLKEGDCVLFDVGCLSNSYCSDMTRTYFYRSASPKQREVYDIVKTANETAQAMIRPGVRFCDIDHAAREVIEQAGYGEYFTHRLGHSIGIEVHEYGDVSSTNTAIVEAGMIFSVEPGIYLPNELGVRIEDLVLVTETGSESLNQSCSKELEIIG